jgi:A/G-specific adenine glycosylase
MALKVEKLRHRERAMSWTNVGHGKVNGRLKPVPVLCTISPSKVRTFRTRLLRWFDRNARVFTWRKPGSTVYHKIVAEVLLQRTRAEVVKKFLPPFLKQYPSWNRLAAASEEQIGTVLKPLGLWKRRAASLTKLACEMASRRGRFPKNRQELELLPGVGQYITNAVMLFCNTGTEPLLDVNMARLLERYFGPRALADIRYDPYLQALSRWVIRGSNAVRMNWAILDFAAIVCTVRNPACNRCPLSRECKHYRQLRCERVPESSLSYTRAKAGLHK